MSVLSVAESTGAGEARDSEPADQSDTSQSEETVDVAERLTIAIEDFLDGFVPLDYRMKLDWNTLAPLVSTVSAAATIALALRGRV